MDTRLDLDAYLARIGYTGPRAPTLDVLRAVALQHATSIPFENLNPFLGIPVELGLQALQRKLVQQRRGGYCFEQNLLLAQALRLLGFDVTGLAARVLWNQPEDSITRRSHMLLRVGLPEGPYVVDVGFGGMTLTGALALRTGEQPTPHEPFRLLDRDGDWWMQGLVAGEWKTLYRFDLQPQHAIDYDAANYFLSTHPSSHFVTGLVIARPVPQGRYALRGRELAFHRLGGASERRTLQDVSELCHLLEGTFGLRLPDAPQLPARFAAIFESGPLVGA